LANFYEDKKDRETSWEDVGGFNTRLLSEIRNAVMTVEEEDTPPPSVPGAASSALSWWIRRIPSFDFPDDEIG
jgi:hypothetical protein